MSTQQPISASPHSVVNLPVYITIQFSAAYAVFERASDLDPVEVQIALSAITRQISQAPVRLDMHTGSILAAAETTYRQNP